jgi:leucyl aminopeptidase
MQNLKTVHVKLSSLQTIKPQLSVVFVTQTTSTGKKKETSTNVWGGPAGFRECLTRLAENKFFEGKKGESYCLREANIDGFRHILFVGLGDEKKINAENLRRAGASAYKAAKSQKASTAGLLIPNSWPKGLDAATFAAAVTEGIEMGSYVFNSLKSKKDEEPKVEFYLLTSGKTNKSLENAVKDASILVDSINFARWLGDMPGNQMTPAILADSAADAAKGSGIKIQVWDKARIKKEKMGLLLGVSLGSSEEPRFIVMEYKGAAASKKPVCFVGKGLTFDSGGISIKPSASMEEMKYDMCGGAAVIATILALAKSKAKVNAIAIIPSSENMPGPNANKPGDIMAGRNGKTVEVNNTDAEGRLILADALVYASELKPAVIIDAATLTGAIVVALGDMHTGYFTRDSKLVEKIEEASEASGENLWHMPLVDEHVEDMKGAYGDLSNIASNKGAGSAHGAAFLEQFVDKDIPWAHFDIAGTAWNTGHRIAYNPRKGASGVIIRTFVELAKSF